MAKKGERGNHPPKKAGIPADFTALREYGKIVLAGFRPQVAKKDRSSERAAIKAKFRRKGKVGKK